MVPLPFGRRRQGRQTGFSRRYQATSSFPRIPSRGGESSSVVRNPARSEASDQLAGLAERPIDDRAAGIIEGDALGLGAVLEVGSGNEDAGLDLFLGKPVHRLESLGRWERALFAALSGFHEHHNPRRLFLVRAGLLGVSSERRTSVSENRHRSANFARRSKRTAGTAAFRVRDSGDVVIAIGAKQPKACAGQRWQLFPGADVRARSAECPGLVDSGRCECVQRQSKGSYPPGSRHYAPPTEAPPAMRADAGDRRKSAAQPRSDRCPAASAAGRPPSTARSRPGPRWS